MNKQFFIVRLLIFTCSILLSFSIFSQETKDSIDLELLQIDIEQVKSGENMNLPMSIGAFGVKEYPGSAGASDVSFKLGEKQFAGISFSIGKSDRAKQFYDFNTSHKVFCNIIVLTDFYDNEDYTHTSNLVSSRNHPNYLGIGTVKTNDQKIDYISFVDFSSETLNSYAVISGKLFNLNKGNSILVIPQKDLSLQFVQFHIEEVNFMNINAELKEELVKKRYYINIFGKTAIGQ